MATSPIHILGARRPGKLFRLVQDFEQYQADHPESKSIIFGRTMVVMSRPAYEALVRKAYPMSIQWFGDTYDSHSQE